MTNDTFKEDLFAVCLQARIAQMMVQIMRDNPILKEENPLDPTAAHNYHTLARLSKEVFQKLDWYVSVACKILKEDESFKQELDDADHKIANMADMSSYIAKFAGDLTMEVSSITSSETRRESLWRSWCAGIVQAGGEVDQVAHWKFNDWYKDHFPNTIPSLQITNNDPVR